MVGGAGFLGGDVRLFRKPGQAGIDPLLMCDAFAAAPFALGRAHFAGFPIRAETHGVPTVKDAEVMRSRSIGCKPSLSADRIGMDRVQVPRRFPK